MSAAHSTTSTVNERFEKSTASLSALFLLVGGVSLAITAFGAYHRPDQFAHSWLFGFYYFYTICMGSFFWTVLHHAVDAEWSVVVRRQLENVISLFPYITMAAIPMLIFCAPHLYKWMAPDALASDPELRLKLPYLTKGFFYSRAVFYFVFLLLASYLLRSYSRRQDATGNPIYTVWLRRVSIASIALFAITVTFSAIDWLMGLNYHWYSTMWGVYLFAGSAQSSMAFLIILISLLRAQGYLKNSVSIEHYHVMGKLMFAFTVFWAYIAFSQYMLIWYANLPEETVFFHDRNHGTWRYVSIFLVCGQFVIPFLMLIFQAPKRSFNYLLVPATWILFTHAVDLYWIIMPTLHMENVHPHYLDVTSLLGIGGFLGFFFLRTLSGSTLIPIRDPRLERSIRLTN